MFLIHILAYQERVTLNVAIIYVCDGKEFDSKLEAINEEIDICVSIKGDLDFYRK